MADLESQRKELLRLLDSATDAHRRQHVEKALAALDNQIQSGNSPMKQFSGNNPNKYSSPSSTSHVTTMHNQSLGYIPGTVDIESMAIIDAPPPASSSMLGMGGAGGGGGGGRIGINRPMSARVRRPSIGASLDAIPENKVLKQRTFERNVEIELEAADVKEVMCSSQDPSNPPSASLFDQGKLRKMWMSTGMIPQTLTIHFNSNWVFRKIQVVGMDVEKMSVSCGSSDRSVTASTSILSAPMEALSNMFVYDAKVRVPPSLAAAAPAGVPAAREGYGYASSSGGGGGGGGGADAAWGNQIVLRIEQASACFPAILGIQVIVVPYLPDRK